MKKFTVLKNPTNVADIKAQEFFDEIASDWELRAERLRERRWHKLKREMY